MQLKTNYTFLLFLLFSLAACNKKVTTPATLDPSPSGNLGRYDLATEDYDVLPVTTFVFSYDNTGNITNVFEKSSQTLVAYALNYNDGHLIQTTDNTLGVQNFSYDANGRLTSLSFMDLADTGTRTFTYDNNGQLISWTDSVKKPNALPTLMQYLLTYDSTQSNVVLIIQNQLDLEHRPTLVQENFYTFDDKPNPFTACPWLRDATTFPGSLPALINKNNIVGTHIVGTIFQTSGGSSVPKLDTLTNYISTRQYTYNTKGYPITCGEAFQDLQYNYSGNRSFTYDY
ncbi:MAG TPA: RHS repeat domain-containing protein [Puia sp.]|nr:RHS repeat domain-containing protein [Puia sp.]